MIKLFNKIKEWFIPGPQVKFRCVEGAFNVGFPVRAARKEIPEWAKNQVRNKDLRFAKCPGMFDHAQTGYIIPAWTDISIKVNRQGTFVKLLHPMPEKLAPSYMDYSVIDGMLPIKSSAAKRIMKVSTPWAIFTKKGYSVQLLPAFLHANYLDKIFVYPGVVDYDTGFTTCNFIFTGLEECEFTIYAGEPLLQAIPIKREDFHATVSKASESEKDSHVYGAYSRAKNFYRKTFHVRKNYTIENI